MKEKDKQKFEQIKNELSYTIPEEGIVSVHKNLQRDRDSFIQSLKVWDKYSNVIHDYKEDNGDFIVDINTQSPLLEKFEEHFMNIFWSIGVSGEGIPDNFKGDKVTRFMF